LNDAVKTPAWPLPLCGEQYQKIKIERLPIRSEPTKNKSMAENQE
jgi:hypothetical protein